MCHLIAPMVVPLTSCEAPQPPQPLTFYWNQSEKAMDTYINDSLAAGTISPSFSPAGSGVFFVSKKEGSLRPCSDYHGLNCITVKNRYPLPLILSAFELLQ